MKIGQFTDSFLPVVDGVGRVLESYAQTLGAMRHDVTVFAPYAEMGDISGRPYRVVTYNTLRIPRFQYRVGVPQLDVRFARRKREIPLDIVHVHSPFMLGHSGLHLAKRRGLPVVATFHSKFYDDFKQVLKLESAARFGTRQVVDFFEKCDEVWAVTGASGETLREYGYRGPLTVMPNGVALRTLDTTVIGELTARYGLRGDVPVLLFVGQMNWKKNILRILEAARLLADEGASFQLLLAGLGPHQEEIDDAIARLSLRAHVKRIGHISSTRELDGLYSLARLFVFPSLYDNGPMVLREAAAMGTPAVLIKGSSAAEAVQHGVNGLTCEDTAEALKAAIASILSDEALGIKLGERARETIPVPWPRLMEQVIARYEALIAAQR